LEFDPRKHRRLRPDPGAQAKDRRLDMVADLSVVADRHVSHPEFAIEDMWVGVFGAKVLASGFGRVADGRSFAFRIEGPWLLVEIYRPLLSGPVPQPEDIVATLRYSVIDVDVTDERSLTAAVRDAVALAEVAN
jgi:hypothetical protein